MEGIILLEFLGKIPNRLACQVFDPIMLFEVDITELKMLKWQRSFVADGRI